MDGPAAFRLRTTFAQAMPAVQTAAAQVWRQPGLRERYPEYLRTMHGVIRASVPLMELAARCCAERPDDPIAASLRGYLLGHIDEERGHDDWLLDDLAALGHALGPLASTPPPPTVARLVGAQYYWITHHHPVALLGYIAVLEVKRAPRGTHRPTPGVGRATRGRGADRTRPRRARHRAHPGRVRSDRLPPADP